MEDLERRFEDFVGGRLSAEGKGWMPATDLYEKDDRYIVRVDLPGMKEEDIEVSIVGDMLTIKGEKQEEMEVKEEDYYQCERSYGSFFRSIDLPSMIDAGKIEASYMDGVLEVTLPKSAEVKPKKIAVSAKKSNH
jgi:HSP20 family protein